VRLTVEQLVCGTSAQATGTKVCRYNWHSADFLGWPFSMLKCNYIFKIKYTEAILSNSTRKLLWFEITNMLIAVKKIKFIVLFIIIFGTLSSPVQCHKKLVNRSKKQIISNKLF